MVFKVNLKSVTTKAGVGTSHDLVDLTGILDQSLAPQIRVMCKGVDAVVKFGDSTVEASETYSGDDLATGNIVVLAGAVEVFAIDPDVTHASVISEDGSSTGGFLFFTAGNGEN